MKPIAPMKLWARITLDERPVNSVALAARVAPSSATVALEMLLAGGHVVCGVMTARGRQVASVRRADGHGQPDITPEQWREAMLAQRTAPEAPAKRSRRWLTEWIEARASSDGECLLWARAVRKGCGTPMARLGKQTRPARRALWEALHGRSVPAGYRIMASCGKPACVALGHLAAMTHSESCLALAGQGRFVDHRDPQTMARRLAAMREGGRALGVEGVERIRAGRDAGRTCASIAEEIGVAESTVSSIGRGVRQSSQLPGASVFTWRPT